MEDAKRAKITRWLRSPLRYTNETAQAWIALPRLQQKFTTTHPSVCALSQRRGNAAGMCSFCHYLGTGTPTHAHLSPTHTPARPHFSPSCSSNCRIPNLGLALPYQEVKTSPTQTMETPLWWCQMCCQMDPPWADSCELLMSFLIDISGFILMVYNKCIW